MYPCTRLTQVSITKRNDEAENPENKLLVSAVRTCGRGRQSRNHKRDLAA
eukprot:COSAG06_NODE_65402_length_257_cov_0.645570_1_plen_49_part_10